MSLIRTRHTWMVFALMGFMLSAFLPAAFGSTFFLPLPGHHFPPWLSLLPWAVYLAVCYAGGRFYETRWHTREGTVSASEQGLFLNGALVLARRGLRHGALLREGDRLYLRLHRRAPFAAPYDVEVADEAEARRLLADLRFDAQTSTSEFELHSGTARSATLRRIFGTLVFLGLFILPIYLFRRHHEDLMITGWFTACAWAMYLMTAFVMQATVGADGIRLKRVVGRTRFVAYADLADVKLEGKNLRLELKTGEKITLHRDQEGPLLEERIREALKVHRARNVNAAATFTRGERSTVEWLRATKERSPTYRQPEVPDDELWTVVEDAAASPTERAGAALALRMKLDDVGQNRLRIAAGACAEKKLRVALESVAERADDEELAAVLEPLEERRLKRG